MTAATSTGAKRELALAFGIRSEELVLDVGCGAQPFPLATHLTDRSLRDHAERFGLAIPLDHRPFIECTAAALPFGTGAFDFAYCAHVLEHVADPARACAELMRVSKRGYIECPRSWFEVACSSDEHRWLVDHESDVLVFREKLPEEYRDVIGIRATMLARIGDPSFAHYWNAPAIRAVRNVQFSWTGAFAVHVLTRRERRHGCTGGRRAAWSALWRKTRRRNDREELAAQIAHACTTRTSGT
jgi:ubiquinone/menaquinone biosynthesis C-methylase UbiE